jgi:hypothetical protein
MMSVRTKRFVGPRNVGMRDTGEVTVSDAITPTLSTAIVKRLFAYTNTRKRTHTITGKIHFY